MRHLAASAMGNLPDLGMFRRGNLGTVAHMMYLLCEFRLPQEVSRLMEHHASNSGEAKAPKFAQQLTSVQSARIPNQCTALNLPRFSGHKRLFNLHESRISTLHLFNLL